MSNVHGTFAVVVGQTLTENVGGTGLSSLVIGNESGLTAIVTLQGANVSKTLYPSTVDRFDIPTDGKGKYLSWSGNVIITFSALLNNQASWPGSYIQIDTYGIGEAPNGTYPMALPRNTNVGNTIPLSSSATSITNTGNVAGTAIINAQVLADGSNAVLITNDAQVTLGDATHNAVITVIGKSSFDNGAFKTDGSGNITAQDILFDGHLGVSANADTIDANSATATYIKARNNGVINFQTPNGTTRAHIDSSGIHLDSGTINFLTGTMSRQNGSISSCGSGTTISHGIGASPATIVAVPNIAQPGSATAGVGNIGSTTFQATIGAGTQLNWWGLAG